MLSLIVLLLAASAADAKCAWHGKDGQVQCDLKILDFRRNSSSATMQVPPPGLTEVKRLKVLCSEVFFFESQLRSDHLGSLDALTDLEISFCKLRTLPPRTFVGLRGLSSLVIHTHNEDWTSLQMDPDYESLVGLERLKRLDMQLNNLHRLPPGFFCPLKNLVHIDLSFNAIKDLSLLGISRAKDIKEEFRCPIPAQSLALRHNGLVTATPRSLAGLAASLRHLDLSHNQIDVLVEATFDGLSSLETIDISHNNLAALPPKIFAATPHLRTLILDNNTLGTIDLDVFANLTQLQSLNMSGNNLDENWIRPGIFSSLHNLVVLDLSANHIARLDQGLLDELTALQVLNLSHNKIYTIATNSFLHLTNLHILALQSNQLESVQRQTLTGLSLLNTLSLDRNKIHTLHKASLRNCTSLTSLSLSHNFLTQTPEAVHSTSLESLDLSSNLLGVLIRESLQGMPKLRKLNLGNNELSRLGEGTFVEVASLVSLDLSRNRFMSLEQDTFKDLKSLQSLDLSQNQLEDVNGLFTHQVALQTLNLSLNHLSWFDYAFIPHSLVTLDIHANNIDSLGNYYAKRDNFNLQYVDASVNAIASLHVLSISPGIVEINLSNNTITQIAPKTFLGKKNLVRVHLERNRLETLEMASLMVSLEPHQRRPPQFFLAGNPFRCDCHLQWLHQMTVTTHLQTFEAINAQLYPEIPDLEQVTCRVLNTTHPSQFFTRGLTRLDEKDFLCPYETHCLALCLCCDFLACDCQMKCPDDCQCFHDKLWSANLVQCSDQKLQTVPSLVPMDVTALHLNGNNLTHLTPAMFLGRSRLRRIMLGNSNVYEIDNATFSGLDHLEVIDLGFNQLKQLFGYEFSGAVSLRELHLHHNQLVTIDPQTFKHLSQLTVLRLDGNYLIEFPIWNLNTNKYLNWLTLSSNWWSCECSFVRKFRMFIDTLGPAVVKDVTDIACNSDYDKRIGQSNCMTVLPNQHFYATQTTSDYRHTIPVIIGVTATFLALFVAVGVFMCLKDKFRIWLYSRCGIRVDKLGRASAASDESSPTILFDALLLYSERDVQPYVEEFCQNMEPTYRLCLLYRDLTGIYTSEAFKSALEASRRHIVMMSPSFFANEWQRFQQEHLPDLKKLIVIKLKMDEPDVAGYDEAAANAFLSSLSSKVLAWSGEDRFWQTVRYYLPDPPKLPTKEGGAELDLSGVWTFNGDAAIGRKNSISDSGVYDSSSVHQQPFASTRSCGTNAVNYHQRSSSALVETIRHVERSSHHQRSKSYLFPQASAAAEDERPPTPPVKIGKMQRPSGAPTYASHSSILYKLAATNPALMESLNATMMTPLEPSPPPAAAPVFQSSKVKLVSPVVKAKAKESHHHHSKSLSLATEMQQRVSPSTPKTSRFQNNRQYHHRKSASLLDPMQQTDLVPSNPIARCTPPRNPVSHHHSRSVSMLDSRPVTMRLENLDSRKILNMSTSQLHQLASKKSTPKGAVAYHHQRSSSTPYEGFVL